MKSIKSETIAGVCRQCHSDVHLANKTYSCQCGRTSEESYDFPPSWVFELADAKPIYRTANAVSAQQIG